MKKINDGFTNAQRYYKRHSDYQKKWKEKNKEHYDQYVKDYYRLNKIKINKRNKANRLKKIDAYKGKEKAFRIKVKTDVINNYGGKCACCGEERLDFLTVDHINNDGAEHRKIFGRCGKIHRFLRTHGYPSGFQILCFNCNYSKFYNHGKCIHQIEKENNANVSIGG